MSRLLVLVSSLTAELGILGAVILIATETKLWEHNDLGALGHSMLEERSVCFEIRHHDELGDLAAIHLQSVTTTAAT
jgi:hypothetical protein